jgi:hypothetical protein
MCFILNGWPGGQRKDRGATPGPVSGSGASQDETEVVPAEKEADFGCFASEEIRLMESNQANGKVVVVV